MNSGDYFDVSRGKIRLCYVFDAVAATRHSRQLVSKTTRSVLSWIGAQVSGPLSAIRPSPVPLDRRVDASQIVRGSSTSNVHYHHVQ